MSETVWRFAFASVAGTSHAETATPCQDASRCELMACASGEPILVAVAADGAGSATHAAQGAQLACAQLIECARAELSASASFDDIDQAIVLQWLRQIRHSIEQEAELAATDSRAFACTLLVALIGPDRAMFAQIGDGAMVIATADQPNEYQWVFWPEQGEYVNTTRFITDAYFDALINVGNDGDGDGDDNGNVDDAAIDSEAADDDDDLNPLQCRVVEGLVTEVAVFTDGLQHLALQYEPPRAYAPFFNGIFPPVRKIAPEQAPMLSNALAAYLNLPKVNARTNDDKTLILATRLFC